MAKNDHIRLQIPQGTESFHLDEAYRHRRIMARLEEITAGWGYLPVETPVFDFYDTYRPLLNRRAQEKIYRLIDREGDLLMLRSDITLFLARQISLLIKERDLPLRISYADSILRHEDQEDISRNEFFQTGAELIGVPGREGDREILLMAWEIFRALGLKDTVFHLGSRALFDTLCREVRERGDAPQEEALQRVIPLRDTEAFRRILAESGFSLQESGVREKLFFFIGTPDEKKDLLKENLPAPYAAALEELLQLTEELSAVEPDLRLRLDFSEIGDQPYYTGLVFSAYTPGAPAASATGGRYDSLLGSFGKAAPSVGFSLLLRQLEPLMEKNRDFSPPQGEILRGETFAEQYKEAQRLRQEGRTAVFTYPSETKEKR